MLAKKRSLFLTIVLSSLLSFSLPTLAELKTVTDIAERSVELDLPVKRIILADSRALLAMNVLHPNEPFKSIVAWDNALQKKSPDIATAYGKQYPEINDIPVFSNPYTTDFNVEKAFTYQPDMVIFDIGLMAKLKQNQTIEQLEKMGVKTIFIDFRQKPLTNSMPSMLLLGEVFGQQQKAQRFVDFYQSRLSLIEQRVATLKDNERPLVFLARHAGLNGYDDCCSTFGRGSFGEFIAAAGGDNLGAKFFDGFDGELNLEQLITSNPAIYMMTGADWKAERKASIAVNLGYTATQKVAEQELATLMANPKLQSIKAIQDKRVMAIYHQYYDSPFNILAVEAMAKFMHPTLFADLDPDADNRYIHSTFIDLKPQGLFWVMAK